MSGVEQHQAWGALRYRLTHLQEPFWVEFWSGITAMAWAAMVWGMPFDLSDLALYRVLATIMTDVQWEWTAIVLGSLQVFLALANCRWGRWMLAFFMSWWWLTLGYGAYYSATIAPGVVVYGGWGMANLTSMALLFRRGHER